MSRTASPASASEAAPSNRVPFGGTVEEFAGEFFGGAIVSGISSRGLEQLRLRHKLRRKSQYLAHRFQRHIVVRSRFSEPRRHHKSQLAVMRFLIRTHGIN